VSCSVGDPLAATTSNRPDHRNFFSIARSLQLADRVIDRDGNSPLTTDRSREHHMVWGIVIPMVWWCVGRAVRQTSARVRRTCMRNTRPAAAKPIEPFINARGQGHGVAATFLHSAS
jgi:hypothetical protein